MNENEDVDPTALAVSTAYNYGISPYVVFDISHALSDCENGSKQIDSLISKIHRFTLRYRCDGIILDDYYIRKNTDTFGKYMNNGSGVGYTNWMYDTAEQLFSTAADIIHMTDNSIAVGFMINDMWANSTDNPEGSETADTVQAFYDGHADTKKFIEKNYVDFALLRAYGSLTDGMLPFETVTGWWGNLAADYDMPLYIVHYKGKKIRFWPDIDRFIEELSGAFPGQNKNIQKFYKENCLIHQAFVKDGDIDVETYVKNNGGVVKSMIRYEVGEGMEKRSENFAEEGAKQINA